LVSSFAGGDPGGGFSGSTGLGGTVGFKQSYKAATRSVLGLNDSI